MTRCNLHLILLHSSLVLPWSSQILYQIEQGGSTLTCLVCATSNLSDDTIVGELRITLTDTEYWAVKVKSRYSMCITTQDYIMIGNNFFFLKNRIKRPWPSCQSNSSPQIWSLKLGERNNRLQVLCFISHKNWILSREVIVTLLSSKQAKRLILYQTTFCSCQQIWLFLSYMLEKQSFVIPLLCSLWTGMCSFFNDT